jgi:tRNA dimethylallyltransferase
MTSSSKILALVGPTASGKTMISLILAQLLKGEIVSADSRQVYRHMDIGTAKPSREDRARIEHHCIDIRDPSEDFSAGEFAMVAQTAIREIRRRGRLPIVVGGSGLYLRSAVDGLFAGPHKDPETRIQLEDRLARNGIDDLLDELRRVDPKTASKIDATKPRRVIRALEVFAVSGVPLSQLHHEQQPIGDWVAVHVGLLWRREELNRRIDQRVDDMMELGLFEEVKALNAKGFDTRYNALNTVGYKELFDVLMGKSEFTDASELIKRNTRRYAKRQMTWFRADRRIQWVEASEAQGAGDLAQKIVHIFRES